MGNLTFKLLKFSFISVLVASAYSAPRRNLPGFSTSSITANDDGSVGPVSIGFSINIFGATRNSLFVNNNGNVTFDASLGSFTPTTLATLGAKIIAPYFADVDTRGPGSGLVTYGNATVDGHNAFGVEWPNVGYYNASTNKTNTFELVIIDRSDISPGAFDMEFNYDSMQWETGSDPSSGGVNGLGGFSARAGFANGVTGTGSISFELPGSGVNGGLINGGPNALVTHDLNTSVLGRYLFTGRGGTVNVVPQATTTPVGTPATTTPLLILSGMMLIGIVTYLKARTA